MGLLWRLGAVSIVVLGTMGCGDDAVEEPVPVPPPDGCGEHELLVAEGICIEPGVPLDGCAEGFTHDGDRGCEPILPPAPCAPGQIATPGDTTCRALAPCGDAPWGDIPTDDTTVYVDAAYVGGNSDGSAQRPWVSLQQAINGAARGALVAIAAGSYVDNMRVLKPLRLWGRCPELVEIRGTGFAALSIESADVEVHTMAFSGPTTVVVGASGALNTTFDRVWIHDAPGNGLLIDDTLGPTSAHITESLIEGVTEFGLFANGTAVVVERSVLRDTQLTPAGTSRALNAQLSDTGARPNVEVRSCLLERNFRSAIYVGGGDLTVDATVVRDTQVGTDGLIGNGLSVFPPPFTPERSVAVVTASVFERNAAFGIAISNSDATVDRTIIRDTAPRGDGLVGRGINIEFEAMLGTPADVRVSASVIERNADVGVITAGSNLDLQGSVIRHTVANLTGEFGRGVAAQPEPEAGTLGSAAIEACLIEENESTGVFRAGVELSVDSSLIRNNGPRTGRGITLQFGADHEADATATVRDCRVENNAEFGIAIIGADLTLEGTVISGTQPSADGLFGDGIAVASVGGPAVVSVSNTRLTDNVRAGMANFGGSASLLDSSIRCNRFDLESEPFDGVPASYEDRGGNVCGCEQEQACAAVTIGLAPPDPLP